MAPPMVFYTTIFRLGQLCFSIVMLHECINDSTEIRRLHVLVLGVVSISQLVAPAQVFDIYQNNCSVEPGGVSVTTLQTSLNALCEMGRLGN